MEFLHPHISSTIIDNSGVVVPTEATTTTTGTIMFAPFFSERGRDNQIIDWTDATAFLAEYGTPNMKKYGQDQYNAVRWLLSGGMVRGMRLLPTDAAYANSFVTVEIDFTNANKTDDADTGNVVVKTVNEHFDELSSEEDVEAKLTEEVTTDEEGSPLDAKVVRKRLFAVIPTGRGEYGKAYKFTLKLNTLYKDTYDFPLYNFEIFKVNEKGVEYSVEGPFIVALKPDAIAIDGSSLFIQNVLDEYATSVKVIFNDTAYDEIQEILDSDEENYQVSFNKYTVSESDSSISTADATGSLFDAINASRGISGTLDSGMTTVNTVAPFTSPEELDFIFGVDSNNNVLQDEVAASDKQTFITLQSTVGTGIDLGYNLSGEEGSALSLDGEFASKDADTVNRAKDKLLIAAFGNSTEMDTIDKRIFEVRNYPVDVVLDAGHSNDVKAAMQNFSELRKDVFIFYDLPAGNATSSASQTILTKANYTFAHKYDSALFGQTWVVADTYTSADIKVTFSYFLATLIPVHDRVYGCHRPMAGAQRGVIPDSFKKMSFNPTEQEKEDLYNNQINYAEQTTAGTRINSQITMQQKVTALSNINNVRTLFLIIRGVENISDRFEFEYANNDTINNFQAAIDAYLIEWRGACSSITGQVYQSDYDRAQKIARVRLDIVFLDIIERIAIEVNVGRS